MGSDLAMNPPRPDMFRARWEGDNLIVERSRDGIWGDGGGWREVINAPVTPEELAIIEWWTDAVGGFSPPEKPRYF